MPPEPLASVNDFPTRSFYGKIRRAIEETRRRGHLEAARRSRDIGLADPRAVEQAIAVMQTIHFLSVPEVDQALTQLAIYLAVAQKSDAAFRALNAATEAVRSRRAELASCTRAMHPHAMKQWGYDEGYQPELATLELRSFYRTLEGRCPGKLSAPPPSPGPGAFLAKMTGTAVSDSAAALKVERCAWVRGRCASGEMDGEAEGDRA